MIGMSPSNSEPSMIIDLAMIERAASRVQVETTLDDLAARGLLVVARHHVGPSTGERVADDDLWSITRAGRAMIGQLPGGEEPA
jgi:hypothetical protein